MRRIWRGEGQRPPRRRSRSRDHEDAPQRAPKRARERNGIRKDKRKRKGKREKAASPRATLMWVLKGGLGVLSLFLFFKSVGPSGSEGAASAPPPSGPLVTHGQAVSPDRADQAPKSTPPPKTDQDGQAVPPDPPVPPDSGPPPPPPGSGPPPPPPGPPGRPGPPGPPGPPGTGAVPLRPALSIGSIPSVEEKRKINPLYQKHGRYVISIFSGNKGATEKGNTGTEVITRRPLNFEELKVDITRFMGFRSEMKEGEKEKKHWMDGFNTRINENMEGARLIPESLALFQKDKNVQEELVEKDSIAVNAISLVINSPGALLEYFTPAPEKNESVVEPSPTEPAKSLPPPNTQIFKGILHGFERRPPYLLRGTSQ